MLPVTVSIIKVISELNQQMPELARFEKRFKAFMKMPYDFRIDLAFVGEASVQLGGEEKIRALGGFLQP